ncbi:uncharacterized protein LOC124166449 [Ischnura elegans]|uniref:uncharacterized protein LOC124166449 n=1 Tax=Ischnura elegans TaxID=197161 RepID=UPI001ED8A303|nr:uncharacterized protein LOC124166449 [Ischnura elegans]
MPTSPPWCSGSQRASVGRQGHTEPRVLPGGTQKITESSGDPAANRRHHHPTEHRDSGAVASTEAEKEEEEEAAIKIQAVFRGHQTRKAMRSGTGDEEQAAAAEERAALEAEFNPEDEELCHAATKIQASFRGHMARKQGPKGKTDEELSKEMEKLDAKGEEEVDELADIDLSDPELNKAATKIQASFRGHKVRKEGPATKEGEGGEGGNE